MMNCREATALMSQQQDRRLKPVEWIGLRLHVMICNGCANYRRQMATLRAACRRFSGRD